MDIEAKICRENLIKICEAYDSQRKVADILDYPEDRISRLVSKGKTEPDRYIGKKVRQHIEKSFGVPHLWLAQSNTMSKETLRNYLDLKIREATSNSQNIETQPAVENLHKKFELLKNISMDFIPFYDLESSSREGNLVKEEEDAMHVSKELINELNLDIEQAGGVKIKGHLMEPTLKDKSELLIDFLKRQVETGKIYLIKINNRYSVRRIYEETNDTFKICYDNQAIKLEHPDILMTKDNDSLEICGKVVCAITPF